jgi:hypothetical protein
MRNIYSKSIFCLIMLLGALSQLSAGEPTEMELVEKTWADMPPDAGEPTEMEPVEKTWADIPPELLGEIFSHLKAPDLANAARVSKVASEVARPLLAEQKRILDAQLNAQYEEEAKRLIGNTMGGIKNVLSDFLWNFVENGVWTDKSKGIIEALRRKGATLSQSSKDGFSEMLIRNVAARPSDFIKALYYAGFDINATLGRENKTALDKAFEVQKMIERNRVYYRDQNCDEVRRKMDESARTISTIKELGGKTFAELAEERRMLDQKKKSRNIFFMF